MLRQYARKTAYLTSSCLGHWGPLAGASTLLPKGVKIKKGWEVSTCIFVIYYEVEGRKNSYRRLTSSKFRNSAAESSSKVWSELLDYEWSITAGKTRAQSIEFNRILFLSSFCYFFWIVFYFFQKSLFLIKLIDWRLLYQPLFSY